MAMNISTNRFKDSNTKEKISNKRTNRSIKGVKYSKEDSEQIINTNDTYKKLKKQGLMENINSNASNNDAALAVLYTLGCSVVSMSSEMSLINSQTDTETIDNENIFDKSSMSKLSNEKTLASDKFPNIDSDPFYTLDDSPPRSATRKTTAVKEKSNTPSVLNITSDVLTINFSSDGTTLKQFKN